MRRRWPVPAVIAVAATLIAGMDARGTEASRNEPHLAPITAQPGGGQELCWHDITSETRCPDSLRSFTDVNPESILTVEVKFTMVGGRTRTKRIAGKADAIFITPNAVRIFALPYYASRDDSKAQRLLDFLRQANRPGPARGRGE